MSQTMPALPPSVVALLNAHRRSGVLQITIDERGMAQDPVLSVGVLPSYDRLLLAAARKWWYLPATQAGIAVKYRKTIVLSVDPR
jgi:hypothetical protein